MKTIMTKLSLIAFFWCCFVGFSYAQTFCLQLSEVSNDGTDYVVQLEIQGDVAFNLGSSNFQFSYNDAALGTPSLLSSTLNMGNGYFDPTVTEPNLGEASFNIELGFPNTGVLIDAAPGFYVLGTITFPITDPAAIGEMAWTYNGGTTETVVFDDDEATQLFVTDPSCLIGITQPAPANDLCADAISILCGDSLSGSTTTATSEPSLATCVTTLNTASGVWYSFVGDGLPMTISLSGSDFDTKLGVFSNSCDSLVCETGNDDSDGLQSEVTFTGVDGDTYFVYVTGFSANTGNYSITLTCTDPNDTDGDGIPDVTDNCPATENADQADLDGDGLGDVCDDDADGDGILAATDCDDLDAANTFQPGDTCDDSDPLTTGDTILADCTCAGIPPVPGNDLCDNAFTILCGDSLTGSTVSASADSTIGTCVTLLDTAPGVWYTVEGDGLPMIISLAGSDFDTKLGVFSNSCDSLVCETGNDDSVGLQSEVTFTGVDGDTYFVYVTGFSANTGNYSITLTCTDPNDTDGDGIPDISDNCPATENADQADLDGDGLGDVCDDDADGDGILAATDCDDLDASVTIQPGDTCDDLDPATDNDMITADCICAGSLPAPANDLCDDAAPILCGDSLSGSTTTATSDADVPFCDTDLSTAPGVWYSVVADGLPMTVSLAGSAYDTKLGVFSNTCDSLICEGGNDDAIGLQSEVIFTGTDGDTYLIYVTGFSAASGDYSITLTCTDPGDVDGDGIADASDNCPLDANPGQEDLDGDGLGDVCDDDADGDGIPAATDCDDLDATITTQPGDSCDDGDPLTEDDMIQANCVCSGTIPGATEGCGAYSNSPSLSIPDLTTVTDDIVVSGTGETIADLNVAIDIDHTWMSDLTINLIAPDLTVVTLYDPTTSCSQDNMNALFDDDGSTPPCNTSGTSDSPPLEAVDGLVLPVTSLAALNGLSFDGTWTLEITDGASGDPGTLVQWCLIPTFEAAACPTDLDMDGDTDGDDFSIFLGNYGLPCPMGMPCPTDFDGDGDTDGDDFSIFLGNYGIPCE